MPRGGGGGGGGGVNGGLAGVDRGWGTDDCNPHCSL